MTPSGPRGSGGPIFPRVGSEAEPSGEISVVSSAEAPVDGDASTFRSVLLTVFNPKARDGQIGRELPYFKRTMERAGFRVIPVETVADEQVRKTRILEASQLILQEAKLCGQKITITPYGGDGTIWQTAEQVLPAAGVFLEPGQTDPQASQNLESVLEFFLPKKGTASDNAVQTGSPSRIPAMQRFLRRAVRLPFWFPTVEVRERPGEYRVAGHNYGLGESGFIFERRAKNFQANPRNPLNRGLFSYLRLLPNAVFNRYGLLGFDVQLRHFDANGQMLQETTRRGSEVIVTPNRIMASVGGVPGAWGDTKIVVLPPGPTGVLAVSEYIYRGLATKMGFNRVGPRSRLRSLSAERQWLVRPGERVDVDIRVPNTVWWDILRVVRQAGASFRGFFDLGPEIPPAGELLKVPAQLNGDLAEPSSGFTVRSPGIAIPMLAHPDSLAVRLARSSALVDGQTPLILDQQVTSFLRNHHPEVMEDTPDALRARTPFVSQPRLMDLLGRRRIPFSRGIELMTAMQGVGNRDLLNRVSDRNLTLERAREFLQSTEGQAWIQSHRGEGRALGQRLLTGGVPLAVGIGAMLGAEVLADRLGLDPTQHRELRFGLVVYLSHAATANFSPFWEVASNRILGRPYDFIRMRTARAAGEIFTQYTFESNGSLWRALGTSWQSGTLGIAAGLEQALWRRSLNLVGLPLRAAFNMGEGLIFSRLTEQLVRNLPDDSPLKRYAPTAAFFLPDLGRLLAPQTATRFFSTRSMRFASRAFAAGFISDMAFTGLHRLAHGAAAPYDQMLNLRASELRRSQADIPWYSVRNGIRLVAPSLEAYFDSHEYLFGEENRWKQEVRRQDAQVSLNLREGLRHELPMLAGVLHQRETEIFSEQMTLTDDEQLMLEQLQACRGGRRLAANADFEGTSHYLQNQFSGIISDFEAAKQHLARIHAYQLQTGLAAFHALQIPEASWIQNFFDERGRLKPDRALAFQQWIHGNAISYSMNVST